MGEIHPCKHEWPEHPTGTVSAPSRARTSVQHQRSETSFIVYNERLAHPPNRTNTNDLVEQGSRTTQLCIPHHHRSRHRRATPDRNPVCHLGGIRVGQFWRGSAFRLGQNLMVDRDEYPQTAEIERRCLEMVANLCHFPISYHVRPSGWDVGRGVKRSSDVGRCGSEAAVAERLASPRPG